MEIYLDANATTPVLPQASAAALATMGTDFGNPSSTHSAGLKARALIDGVRARALRVLGAPPGRLLFVSGATEGIQTAVLSVLDAVRRQRDAGESPPPLLLYGATEHKAVPEALRHWNALLGLSLRVEPIPVGREGRHDLGWLRDHAPRAALVCTMAANNETGVVSDLDGVASALAGSRARWLVDSVQALGKLDPRLAALPIDYAPFSGHKLYAPKGIGLLYVRDGAPLTPLMVGGGQEAAHRSGTENMSGIAALGAVLAALEEGGTFADPRSLATRRDQLAAALKAAFPGLVFNAPLALCLPTTLNFSVPGLTSRLLLDVFDAADLRVSGGSACSSARAEPSPVLEAMGLPEWQTSSAVRLSFGPAEDPACIDEACARIRACGDALRDAGLVGDARPGPHAPDGVTRFAVDDACCYVLADGASRRCIVVDPRPELVERIARSMAAHGQTLAAVLHTHRPGPDESAAAVALRRAVPLRRSDPGPFDTLGWPLDGGPITLGDRILTRLALPGVAGDTMVCMVHQAQTPRAAFVGELLADLVPAGAGLAAAHRTAVALRLLASEVDGGTLLLPAIDPQGRMATTLALESAALAPLRELLDGRPDDAAFAADVAATRGQSGSDAFGSAATQAPELSPAQAMALRELHPALRLVDVRERHEQRLGGRPDLGAPVELQSVPISDLLNALPDWLALPADAPLLFFCRTGNRSGQAARLLRRLGRSETWSLAGGLALWPAARDGSASRGVPASAADRSPAD